MALFRDYIKNVRKKEVMKRVGVKERFGVKMKKSRRFFVERKKKKI